MISVRNVTLRRGVNVVLDSASVTFTPGEKIGLVGRNGAGKTSFFGLLNGTLHEDGGEFSIPAAWKMGQVAQEMPETEQSATDFVIEGDTVLLAAQAEVAAAEASDDGMRMAHAYMSLHDAGAHDAPARAQAPEVFKVVVASTLGIQAAFSSWFRGCEIALLRSARSGFR
jgi:ATP-binding cassette subfamily F protein 3